MASTVLEPCSLSPVLDLHQGEVCEARVTRGGASRLRCFGPKELAWREYAVLFVFLMIVLPLTVWLALPGELSEFYLQAVWAPRLEREFGFKGGQVSYVGNDGRTYSSFGILSVAQGGRLDTAGFLPGDTIWEYHGRAILALYGGLREVQSGETATITVVRRSDSGVKRVELQVEPSLSEALEQPRSRNGS